MYWSLPIYIRSLNYVDKLNCMEKICFRIQKHRITFNNELHKKKSINGFKVRLENRAKPEYGGKYYYHREGVFLRY